MVNIQNIIDDAKCYQTIRQMRWSDGVTCPHCSSASVLKNGKDETQPVRDYLSKTSPKPFSCRNWSVLSR